MSKKEIRRKFREVCLKRDKLACVMCGKKAKSFEEAEEIFDVHHIINRENIINQGYVLQNGITLCEEDHLKAEEFFKTGTAIPGYHPDDLFIKINSSPEKAHEAAKKLKSSG